MADRRAATTELEARLRRVFARLDARIAGMDEAASRRRPRRDVWSAAEIAEHVNLADRYLLILVDKIARKCLRRLAAGQPVPASPAPVDHLEGIARREFAWAHPEHMTPTGEVPIDELRRALAADCERACDLLRRMPAGEGALHRIRMSVIEGDDRLDLYQYLTVIALHAERHLAQMSNPGPPD